MLSLENNIAKQTLQKFAEQLDMFFVNVDDILQYNMINKNMIDNAGLEYFEREQKKVMLCISEYDNSLVCGELSLFFKDDILERFQNNFLTIYLKYSQNDIQKFQKQFYTNDNQNIKKNLVAFDDEDKACQKVSDATVLMTTNEEEDIESMKNVLTNLEF